MFEQVLRNADERLSELPCCKGDGSECNCLNSLHEDFYSRPDSYNCEKKMRTYVLNYGAAYASEIYHYLVATNFMGKINTTRPLKVISLGCGFSPDYFAIKKYFADKHILQPIEYVGVDSSTCWVSVRPSVSDCSYVQADISSPFSLVNPDVLVVSKVFSTLYRNDKAVAATFLNNLEQAVNDSFQPDTRLIFVDINNQQLGRDVFHQKVSTFLPNCTQYYFDGYAKNNWVKISDNGLVFDIPDGLSVHPLPNAIKTVIFEYRK